jgi:hypothetical protein
MKFQLDTMGDHLSKNRSRHCGDIEMTTYLANAAGPVPLVLDLLIVHDRFGSSSDPNLNGHLHYPNDIDRSLNEAASDKIRKIRSDYDNKPPNSTSFMPATASTSGRLHGEFVRLLFLQTHRETDRFFAVLRVNLNLDGAPITSTHILTHHTRKLLVY